MRACTSLACLVVAACGSSNPSTPDAAMGDAPPATVHAVTCPPGGMPTVTAISAHGLVKFVMSPTHNVGPDVSLPSDPGLRVNFGQTACLQFDQTGTFNFQCTAHAFRGRITVQ
jgi:plastocyanin